MIELNIFNPGTSLVGCVRYFYEIHPTGGRSTLQQISILSLAGMELSVMYLVCQLFLLIMIIYYLAIEIIKVVKQKMKYFSSFWNIVELLQIFGALVSITFHIVKEQFISANVNKIAKNPYATISFHSALTSKDFEIGAMSFAIFIATIKLLKMVRFNFHVVIFTKTIRKSFALLLSFGFVFTVVFLAFAQAGCLVFGTSIGEYSSVGGSIWYQLQLVLGTPLPLYEMEITSPIVSKVFAFSFLFSLNIYLMNMFIVIVNDAYVEASDIDKTSEVFKLASFMLERLAGMLPTMQSATKAENVDTVSQLSFDSLNEKHAYDARDSISLKNEDHLNKTTIVNRGYDYKTSSPVSRTSLSSLPHPDTLADPYFQNKDSSCNSENSCGFEKATDTQEAKIRQNKSLGPMPPKEMFHEKTMGDVNNVRLLLKEERLLLLVVSQIEETFVEDEALSRVISKYLN